MRTTPESPDRDLPLGSPIKPEKLAPAPAPTGTPGIYRRPDGSLETRIPAPAPVWHPVVTVDEQCED